jgi:N-acetylmuramoyl-L-alanine amidase
MRLPLVAFSLMASVVSAQSWPIDDCGLEPPGTVVLPLPPRDWEPVLGPDAPALVRPERVVPRVGGVPAATVRGEGSLANKVIYLSPGHGFTWEAGLTSWRTQRPTTNAIIEDLVSIETLSQYLMPMLLNAGARVVPVRELDLQTNLVLVDNGEAGYAEQGAGFSTSSVAGWGRPAFPMNGTELPFSMGTNRLMTSAATATASATYTASIPQDGYYDVSVSYSAFSARVTDAHYVVRHAGGESHFRVNQQRHGGTWVQLGRFYFRRGGTAQVVVQNDSTGSGNISLDAVKFGGGLGLINRGSGVSGRPRFEESSRYHAEFAGAPLAVFAPSSNTPGADRTNDIGTRSRFAAWVHEPGEDAVYVAWHTNAANQIAQGTETYVYGPNSADGTLNFTGVDGGLQLAQAIHQEMINDFRQDAGWNRPTWPDRRVRSANFGELNPGNNPETPSTLLEIAFHDTPADAAHLKEPAFRYLAARAIAQGIIRYFATKDGRPVIFPPEPPTHVSAVSMGVGLALVRWRASPTDAQGVRGAAATSYRVYSSDDGLAWDDGLDVAAGLSTTLSVGTKAKYFRVAGVNVGGVSFPSGVVGVRPTGAGRPKALVVNGFDRLEAATGKLESFPSRYALDAALRIFVEKMNDGSAARLTGQALDVNDVGFDIADADAVAAGDVTLTGYQLLSWFVGRGKNGAGPLSAAEQAAITGFRTQNLPVFFTGAATDTAYVASTFSGVLSGAPGTLSVTGRGPFMGVGALTLDDGSQGTFDTGTPPVLGPSGAAVQLGTYSDGSGAAIGVPAQTVMFGFPFETVVGATVRQNVMREVLAFLLPAATFPDAGVVIPEDAGTSLPDAGPVETDAGMMVEDAGVVENDAGIPGPDGGVVTAPDGGVITRQPLLAFQGGGCSSTPFLVPFLALLVVRSRRKRT